MRSSKKHVNNKPQGTAFFDLKDGARFRFLSELERDPALTGLAQLGLCIKTGAMSYRAGDGEELEVSRLDTAVVEVL